MSSFTRVRKRSVHFHRSLEMRIEDKNLDVNFILTWRIKNIVPIARGDNRIEFGRGIFDLLKNKIACDI